MPREKSLDKQVAKLLKERGAWWLKTQPPNRAGVPDFLVCYRGRFIGIEDKQEGGNASPIQKHEHRKIRNAEGIAAVVTSVEQVKHLLNSIDRMVDNEWTDTC